MGKFFRENGLSLIVFVLFLFSIVGQIVAGYANYNEEQQAHGQPQLSVGNYLVSGSFIEATFENWESEFLQMALFVVLTACLKQKGSPESKKTDGDEPEDADPRQPKERNRNDTPWPVRHGGFVLKLYENSLGVALFALFFLSFGLHILGGAMEYNRDQLEHGGQAISTLAYLTTARMWFESFQNWQSEFLSIGALVVLSIFLRQKGSPESKPVAAPHYETGGE